MPRRRHSTSAASGWAIRRCPRSPFTRSTRPYRGSRISGVSTAAPAKAHAPRFWRASGAAAPCSPASFRRWRAATTPSRRSTSSSRSPRRTLTSRQESLQLTEVRERGGATSLLDVRQAEQLVHSAQAQIVDLERLIEQQENAISVLLGRNPGSIERGRSLIDPPRPPRDSGRPAVRADRTPAGRPAGRAAAGRRDRADWRGESRVLPADLADRHGRHHSSTLSSLFTTGLWSVAGSVVQPMFDAGRRKSQVALERARTEEAILTYQKTVQQAFREVSDALVGYRRAREFRAEQEQLVQSAADARRLTDIRYRGGASSYLDVLDSDTRLFTAELDLAQAQYNELAAFVEIYRALGGGWAWPGTQSPENAGDVAAGERAAGRRSPGAKARARRTVYSRSTFPEPSRPVDSSLKARCLRGVADGSARTPRSWLRRVPPNARTTMEDSCRGFCC